jgi:hypothetical protein
MKPAVFGNSGGATKGARAPTSALLARRL